MRKIFLIVTAFFTLIVANAQSQISSYEKVNRIFVQLKLLNTRYWVRFANGYENVFVVNPLHITAGYNITPRIAFRLGISAKKTNEENVVTGTDTLSNLITETFYSKNQIIDVPILFKYIFSHPGKKLQFYTLAGISLVFARHCSSVEHTNKGIITYSYQEQGRSASYYLNSGLAISYALSKHIATNFELLINKRISSLVAGSDRSILGSSFGVSLVYIF